MHCPDVVVCGCTASRHNSEGGLDRNLAAPSCPNPSQHACFLFQSSPMMNRAVLSHWLRVQST